jgi:hypothetical protein
MAIMLFSLGAILKTHLAIPGHATENTPSGKAMVLLSDMIIIGTWLILTWLPFTSISSRILYHGVP